MICYLATAQDGRRYVGITKRSLAARRAQHERDAKKNWGSLFQRAVREFGPASFQWEVLAEGRQDAIKVLEGALISRWSLSGWKEGFNGRGALYDFGDEPRAIMEGYRDFEHDLDSTVAEIDFSYDLEQAIQYIENTPPGTSALDHNRLRIFGERLILRADQLKQEEAANLD